MANWTILKAAIADIIKTNGNQEITGQLLQNVLNNIVSSVGENATFAGIAIPTTNPGAPDGPVFYLATEAGTYSNFSGIVVSQGEAVILQWKNNAWVKNTSGFATQDAVSWTSYNYIALTRPQLVKIKTNSKALVATSQSSNIEVEFTGNVAVLNAFGKTSKAFGKSGDTFTIPQYKTLLYNLDTDEIEVGELPNNSSRKAVLLHNEAGKIGSGVLAIALLHRLIEQKVPYHVVSNIAITPLTIIKFSNRYANTSGNQALYVLKSNFENAILFFDNGVEFALDFSELEDNNGYIAIPLYSSLVYDIDEGTTKIINFMNVSSEVIVLLHNESSSIGGMLAPYIEYDANDIYVSDRHYPEMPYEGYIDYNTGLPNSSNLSHHYSDKIRLNAGNCLLLSCYCGVNAAAITVYEADTDTIIAKVKALGESLNTYMYYNAVDVDIVITGLPTRTLYYNILARDYKISTGKSIREFANYMLNNMITSPMSSISIVANPSKSFTITVNGNILNGIYPPYNKRHNLQLEVKATSYTVPPFNTLYYYIDSDTIGVSDVSVEAEKATIILAHNENGKISCGIWANYLNAVLEEQKVNLIKDNVSSIETALYREGDQLTEYDKSENKLYRPNGSSEDNYTYSSQWYSVEIGKRYVIKVYQTYTQFNWLMASKVKDGEFIESIIVSPQYSSDAHTVIIYADGTFDQLFISGCKLYEAIASQDAVKWANKKMLCIGDSITDQAYWVNSLASLLGTVVYNRGLSGTTVADSSVANSFCERLDKPSDNTLIAKSSGFPTEADLVLVFGGINDWGRIRDQELGTFNAAVDRTTFYGAWHYLLRGLKAKYPNAVICVLNLHHTYKYDSFVNWHEIEYNNPEDETQGWSICQNNKGNTLEDYRTVIKNVATFYGCHIIDLANCGMSFLDSTDRDNYTTDGLHPNEAGGAVIAKYIAAQLKAIN